MKKYRDHYFCKAKAENYPARSIYKLEELDKKFGLLKPRQKVLDLGAAPGSWSLYAAKRVGRDGQVVAIDRKAAGTVFPPQVAWLQADIFEDSTLEAIAQKGPYNLVVSDMAPATTGVRLTDQARSLELATAACQAALANLAPGGGFVVKIFMGPDTDELLALMRKAFATVKTHKPKSSRAESKETFFVGLGLKTASGKPAATEE